MEMTRENGLNFNRLLYQVVIPPLLTIILFIILIYWLLVPTLERMVYERERNMINNLCNSVWSLAEVYHERELSGELTREEAQNRFKERLRGMRYGVEMKDYFWINDMHARMIMHPYRPDLEGTDMSNFADPAGSLIFVNFVKVVKEKGEGFSEYLWDKRDDIGRVIPKVSYVKGFQPWGWVIGTGAYIEDIERHVNVVRKQFLAATLVVFLLVAGLSSYIIHHGLAIRRQEMLAEEEIRRYNEELSERNLRIEQVNKELREKNAELNDFTYIASHDLQEPLRKLVAFSGLLRKDVGENLPERAEKDLNFISDAARRMQTLVQDLLTLSRTGRVGLKMGKVSLDDCVREALSILADRIEETGAQVKFEPLPSVQGDKTLLIQLYQNLIGNALKFRGSAVPEICFTSEMENGVPVFGVRDNGIGIKPEYMQKIFVPFKRLHGQTEYEGTGIGLAICAKIVRYHSGRIWVESELGVGSHFKFTLAHLKESE